MSDTRGFCVVIVAIDKDGNIPVIRDLKYINRGGVYVKFPGGRRSEDNPAETIYQAARREFLQEAVSNEDMRPEDFKLFRSVDKDDHDVHFLFMAYSGTFLVKRRGDENEDPWFEKVESIVDMMQRNDFFGPHTRHAEDLICDLYDRVQRGLLPHMQSDAA